MSAEPRVTPVVTDELLRHTAERVGVCVRPVIRRIIDNETGELVATVPLQCGSTRERVCKPCAAKARRLRMDQCRAGWHRTDDPTDLDDDDDLGPDPADPDDGDGSDARPKVRRRSTRRLPQFPPLPVVPMEHQY